VNRTAVTVATLAIIAAFAALAVSVVDARRPLDANVSRSFDRSAGSVSVSGASVEPRGCEKERLYFYACFAAVERRGKPAESARWLLLLRDDGCWATVPPSAPAAATAAELVAGRLGPLKGCTG
jgi:hypothetical protein